MVRRRLYDPVKTLGLVCNSLPVVPISLGQQNFVLLSTGFAYQIFNGDTLRIAFSSRIFPDLIAALTCDNEFVYVAFLSTGAIECWFRHDRKFSVRLPSAADSAVTGLFLFGNVLCVTTKGNVELFDSRDGAYFGSLPTSRVSPIGGSQGAPALAHPMGHINKILLGGASANLIALDVVKMKEVQTFSSIRSTLMSHLKTVNKSLEKPSSVDDWSIDVVFCPPNEPRGAIIALSSHCDHHSGALSPLIFMLDLEDDEVLLSFQLAKAQGRVTCLGIKEKESNKDESIANRTSNNKWDTHLLLAGCLNGDVTIFDLSEASLFHTIQRAHKGTDAIVGSGKPNPLQGVRTIKSILTGDPDSCVWLTSGADNSVILWNITPAAQSPVVLKHRTGISGQIQTLRFYDNADEGKEIFVSSNTLIRKHNGSYLDSLAEGDLGRLSFILSQQDCVFPQEKALKKLRRIWPNHMRHLPSIIHVDWCRERHYDWPAVVTCHEGLHQVFVWSALQKSLMPLVLEVPIERHTHTSNSGSLSEAFADLSRLQNRSSAPGDRSPAVSSTLSSCGHFVVVGYADGQLHHFNLQSRNHIGAFKPPTAEVVEDSAFVEASRLAVDVVYETNAIKMTHKRKALKEKINLLKSSRTSEKKICSEKAHLGPVRFCSIQSGSNVFSAAQSPNDLYLRVWDLQTKRQNTCIDIAAALKHGNLIEDSIWNCNPEISHFTLEGNTAILVLSSSTDQVRSYVVLMDMQTTRILRRFGPFFDEHLKDVQVSPAGDWLVVASVCGQRGYLRTYDLQSTQLIDWSEFPAPITAFTWHPSNAFLLTTHAPPRKSAYDVGVELFPVGGVYVWANLSAFSEAEQDGEAQTVVTEPHVVSFPPLGGEETEEAKDQTSSADDSQTAFDDSLLKESITPDDRLLSLSGWSTQQLSALINWDEIKDSQRKSNIDETKPSDQPFFLYNEVFSTTQDPVGWGTDWATADSTAASTPSAITDESSLLHTGKQCKFRKIITSAASLRDCNQVAEATDEAMNLLDRFAESGAPTIHRVIKSLGPLAGEDIEELGDMMWIIGVWVSGRRQADLAQAIIRLFFEFHGSTILEALEASAKAVAEGDEDFSAHQELERGRMLIERLKTLEAGISLSWENVITSLNKVICFIKHVTMIQFD